MTAGPQRLGGSSAAARGLTPQQAAAEAAERRAKDNLWCPSERQGQMAQDYLVPLPAAAAGRRRGAGNATAATTAAATAAATDDAAAAQAAVPPGISSGSGRGAGGASGLLTPASAAGVAAAAAAAGLSRRRRGGADDVCRPALRPLQQEPPPPSPSPQQLHAHQAAGTKRASDMIDLTGDASDDEPPARQVRPQTSQRAARGQASGAAASAAAAAAMSRAAQHQQQPAQAWPCPVCTLINPPLVLQCQACLHVHCP